MKDLLRKTIFLFLARIVARPLLLIYRMTLSIKVCHRNYVVECRNRGENIIYSLWHENMILPLLVHQKQGIYVLVSQHFDGEVIAHILKSFGSPSIRGSSTRGGKEAFFQMRSHMINRHFEITFTPDGPRGPRRQAKNGIIRLAAETGFPIIPMASVARRFIRLKSWDRFFIPSPFTRCVLIHHRPIYIPPIANPDDYPRYAEQLTHIMNDLEKEAEKCLQN